jgi:hypothetical protein
LVLVEEFGTLHRHDHLGNMAQITLIFWQCPYYVPKTAGFRHGITLCRYVKDFQCNQLSFNLARFFIIRRAGDEKIFRFGKSRYFQTLIPTT